jgi:hypothetical protein
MPVANVKIPVAAIPYQNGQLPGPMNEQDVPLEKKKTPKKKRSENGNIETFKASLFPLPTQAPSGFEGEVEYPTGRGYEGPFVEDKKIPTGIGQYKPEKTLFHIPDNRQINIKPAEDTWLSKAIGPSQDELDAEANGLRWHWALEHRFMPPGSKWNETVWNGVDRENAWLTQLLKQKAMEEGKDVNGIMTPMARVRAMGLDKQKWDNFIKGIKDGHYSSMGEITPEALQWAEDFKRMYDSKWGEGSSGELTPIPTVIGKRADLMKKQNFDVRGTLNDTQDAMQNIYEWSKDGSFRDPIKSQMIKNYLDKIAQSLSALLGGDSKSMADAEKVRIQILYLPEKSMDMVKQEIANFRDMLESVMEYGRSKGWSQNIIGKINRAKEAANQASQANGKGNISTLAGMAVSAVGDIMPSLTPQEREQALGLQEGLEAAKLAHESYMQNMVLAADVDPALVYQFAEVLQSKLAKRYNTEMENAERPERAKLLPKFDVDLGQLQREVKPSPFLKPINYRKFFTEISLPERGPGANPSDVIEQGQGDGLSTSTAKTVDKINLGN